MWTTRTRTVAIGGLATVLVGGAVAGTIVAAHAANHASTPTPAAATSTPGASPTTAAAKDTLRAQAIGRLKSVDHAQWTAQDKHGKTVTYDAIRGAVTAVSATSISVKAADGVNETYAVTSSTKVSLAQGHKTKPVAGKPSDVKDGTTVVVIGTGTSSLTAVRVLVPATT